MLLGAVKIYDDSTCFFYGYFDSRGLKITKKPFPLMFPSFSGRQSISDPCIASSFSNTVHRFDLLVYRWAHIIAQWHASSPCTLSWRTNETSSPPKLTINIFLNKRGPIEYRHVHLEDFTTCRNVVVFVVCTC